MFDINKHKIPNELTFTIIGLGVISHFPLGTHPIGFSLCLIGLSVGFVITIFLYSINVFGAGDAKLLASLGFIVGYPNIITLIATAIIFSGLLSVLRLICHGELASMLSRWKYSLFAGFYEKPESNSVAAGAVPMGGAILLAYMYCYFYLF